MAHKVDEEKLVLDAENNTFTDFFSYLTRARRFGGVPLLKFPKDVEGLKEMGAHLNPVIEELLLIVQSILSLMSKLDLKSELAEDSIKIMGYSASDMTNLVEALFSLRREVDDRLETVLKK